MIVKGYIQSTLDDMESLYNCHYSLKKDIYYSKLALIELCGWIEESFDSIIKLSIRNKLKSSSYKKYMKDTIKGTYGFQYNAHFRKMLIVAIGICEAEKLERKIDKSGKIQLLTSTLATLKEIRNENAHSFIKGTTTTIQTPSITKAQFLRIYPIIKELEREIRG
ncbi:endoribonuclease [Subsaximicrobium wynnwilliamsii]|uniref:Endoribonuclease n=1 Tax=Subsaximicrobium wynnwilliamsii TaxID=291179 RepID=A0A5C6ZCR3_9FLAO|nr:endoribonuclease [Subsaximicrobium wynnwilliamsii]TXD81112.1 endoribonuclease [Subsaximicrobium wynnwilliamsii]TXD86849.1 endoribonuclease [Subsaximicrobium wynnwilliamsii]TXE00440.1 endoribonuclease [Subsaximicrobium wynnwilliamsii]